MPQETRKHRILVEGDRLAEVIDSTVARPVEEEDTSVVDRPEADYAPRVETTRGTPEITINCYEDLTDVAQNKLQEDATVATITRYPAGEFPGQIREVYSDVLILERSYGTIGFKGRLKIAIRGKANGGYVRSKVAP